MEQSSSYDSSGGQGAKRRQSPNEIDLQVDQEVIIENFTQAKRPNFEGPIREPSSVGLKVPTIQENFMRDLLGSVLDYNKGLSSFME